MSMILDALKRSRAGQNGPAAIPSVDTQHYIDQPPSSGAPWTKLVLLFAGVAGLGLVASLLMPWDVATDAAATREGQVAVATAGDSRTSRVTPDASETPPPAAIEPSVIDRPPAPHTVGSPEQQRQVADLYRGVQTGVDRGQDSQQSAGTDPRAVPAVSTPEREKVSQPPVSGLDSGGEGDSSPKSGRSGEQTVINEVTDAADSEDNAIDLAELVRRAESHLGKPALVPHDAALLEDLSQQQKDAIPTIMYSSHDWNPGGVSRVTLNGEALTVGERRGGLKVEEILPDSVVLNWRETAFRLRALNSWVNL